MTSGSRPAAEVLLSRLVGIISLTYDERAAVEELPFRIVDLPAHTDVAREGDRPVECCLLIEGQTCWTKTTRKGKRQITSISISGDVPDLHSLHLPVLDSSLCTLTPCRVGFVAHEAVDQLCFRHPNIGIALWRLTLIDGAIFREWVTNVGSRQAVSRIAHLLCEIFVRSQTVGLVRGDECPFPLTQTELGECAGLSTVHVNRSLQTLRVSDLIRLEGNVLTILDFAKLARLGDFDPLYLHLGPVPART